MFQAVLVHQQRLRVEQQMLPNCFASRCTHYGLTDKHTNALPAAKLPERAIRHSRKHVHANCMTSGWSMYMCERAGCTFGSSSHKCACTSHKCACTSCKWACTSTVCKRGMRPFRLQIWRCYFQVMRNAIPADVILLTPWGDIYVSRHVLRSRVTHQHVRRPKVRRQSDVAAKAQKQQHAQDGHRGTASAGKPIGTPPAHPNAHLNHASKVVIMSMFGRGHQRENGQCRHLTLRKL
eukprot:1137234-Pelagomonas_calceolata.AAC.2